jgi:ABC-type amino acid transport substrate-binding protein
MTEFHDDADLTTEKDGDSDLVKSLRSQLRNAHKERDGFKKQAEDALRADRSRSVSDLVKSKGLDPDVAQYVPDTVTDAASLDTWLTEGGKLFSKMLAAPEPPPSETQTAEPGGKPEEDGADYVHPSLAALQQVQDVEANGWNPQLATGEAAMLKALQDLSKQNLGVDGLIAAFQSGKVDAAVASV